MLLLQLTTDMKLMFVKMDSLKEELVNNKKNKNNNDEHDEIDDKFIEN